MTHYLVMINDEQREALITVLKGEGDAAAVFALQTVNQPLRYWVEMLEELPCNEAEDPGTIHGFCL